MKYKITYFDSDGEGSSQEILMLEFEARTDKKAIIEFRQFQKDTNAGAVPGFDSSDDFELYRVDVPEQRTQIKV